MKFKRIILFIPFAIMILFLTQSCGSDSHSKERLAVEKFLDRIGGKGASSLFAIEIDPSIGVVEENGDGGGKVKDVFIISTKDGKPAVTGSSVLAVTTGINRYLNHYAGINLSWNNLVTDLTSATLPLPETPERRECSADIRYYLNYCTFSYSMSTWTWERWEKEIDWMALHGINMPLQIVGLDVVWRDLLMNRYGYTQEEADRFIAGPCFQAWWGMNNLEGWGGPNPDWWYDRQRELAKKICDRERELGMDPVLPGFCGMVPSDFTDKTGIPAQTQGKWCGFQRPFILDPNSEKFPEVASAYYNELEKVMGRSVHYSLDPFHEGADTRGINVPEAYSALYNTLKEENPDAKWVIQQWQWSPSQYEVLNRVPEGELIVLDLFSDARPNFGAYGKHESVYCTLPNFGGRTGMSGRFNGVIEGYFDTKERYPALAGVGATPEGIGQTPILYDLIFDLPWLSECPDPAEWMKEYVKGRYGTQSDKASAAWEKLRNSVLDCRSGLQGPHEAVICARPSLYVDRVSSWGGTDLFYDPDEVKEAAFLLAEADLSGVNYLYDLTDVTRQALTDHSAILLNQIKEAHERGDKEQFNASRDEFLGLILDLDELLSSTSATRLGTWTTMAREIADESERSSEIDRDWLEFENARTLITTWGLRENADDAGLRDYSYRAWGGMLKDFYYQRWKKWFDEGMPADTDWYEWERNWATDRKTSYSPKAQGDTKEIAKRLLEKYFHRHV